MASSTNGNASLSACSSADPLSNGGGCDEDRPSPSLRRKPVPTPRNTLKKKHPQPLTVAAGGGGGLGRRASDLDSQGQGSLDSPSPGEEEESTNNSESCSSGSNSKKTPPSATTPQQHRRGPLQQGHQQQSGGEGGDGNADAGGGDAAGADDILSALERIPGVGNLRSSHENEVGCSMPSLAVSGAGGGGGRFKREESSHSLRVAEGGAMSTVKEGQVSSAVERLRESRNKMLRFNTERPKRATAGISPLKKKVSELSSPSKVAEALSSSSTSKTKEDEDAIKRLSVAVEGDEKDGETEKPKKIQARPLPALPAVKDSEVILNSPATDDGGGGDEGGGSGAYASLVSPDHYTELQSMPPPSSSTLLLPPSGKKKGGSPSCSSRPNSNYLTMTGTIKRGPNAKRPLHHKKPPSISTAEASLSRSAATPRDWEEREEDEEDPVYDVQMKLTAEGLRAIEKRVRDKYHDRCFCGLRRGPHVFLLSLAAIPLVLIYATLSAFVTGTLTWYSIFVRLNEDRGCCWRLLSPLVLLAYPLWIAPVTLCLGLYGTASQVSWYLDSWLAALAAPDGGFFCWFCNWIGDPESSPYQVILLTARDYERPSVLHGATQL